MILVVDDHAMLGRGIRMLLEAAGFPTTHVQSGEAALDFVRSQRPLLVLLDQSMPGMSGLEVLRFLRSDPNLKDIRVIFNSSLVDPAVEEEARELGVWECFPKGSSDWDELIALVRRCIDRPV